jgi:ankyrin repeat protein
MSQLLLNFKVLSQKDQFGDSPIQIAARHGHAQLLTAIRTRLFARNVAETDNDADASVGDTALMRLAAIRNACAQTPLLAAADNAHLDSVRELVRHWRADVLARDLNGYTALHCAASSGHVDCVRWLVDHAGCPVDALLGSDDAYTPLHCAAKAGHADVVRALLALGANCNVVERRYRATAVALAVFNRHTACVHALVAAGADLRVRNCHGQSAFDLALHSSPEIAALVAQARSDSIDNADLASSWHDILGEADSLVADVADEIAELDERERDERQMLLEDLNQVTVDDVVWDDDVGRDVSSQATVDDRRAALLEATRVLARVASELSELSGSVNLPPGDEIDDDVDEIVARTALMDEFGSIVLESGDIDDDDDDVVAEPAPLLLRAPFC